MEESKWIGTFVDSLRKSCSGGRALTGTGPGGVRRGGSMSDSVIQVQFQALLFMAVKAEKSLNP